MALDFAGAAVDVAVTDLSQAERFYAVLVGRACDLRPRPDQREWRLHAQPEVVLRLSELPDSAGHSTAAIGVHDLAGERDRLAVDWPHIPDIHTKPGVIALLRLTDPDGNTVVLWQDLLGNHRPATH